MLRSHKKTLIKYEFADGGKIVVTEFRPGKGVVLKTKTYSLAADRRFCEMDQESEVGSTNSTDKIERHPKIKRP